MKPVLPDNILRRMNPADRQPLGKSGMTSVEANMRHEYGAERVLQNQIAALCEQRNLFYIKSRMDKKTTTRKGMPDFIIFTRFGTGLLVEVKTPQGKLSPDQVKLHKEIWEKTGKNVLLIRSLEEMRKILNQFSDE